MEEKERFELEFEDNGFKNYVLDKENMENFYVSFTDLVILLNKQDNKIKLLEQQNLSLQEQSIRDNQNWIEEVEQLKQSQKQLAIAELEKVKNYFDDKEDNGESEGWIITNRVVVEYVDNQIKELKGEE